MRIAASLAVAVVLAHSGTVTAQALDTLVRRDARVRIWSASQGFIKKSGIVAARERDTLFVSMMLLEQGDSRYRSTRAALPLGAIDRIDVRVRRQSWTGRGFTIGAAVGAAVGIAFPLMEPCGGFDEEWLCGVLKGAAAFVFPVVGVAIGGTAGAVIGRVVRGPNGWVTVPLSRRQGSP